MKTCIECGNPTETKRSSRCATCSKVFKSKVSKLNRDKYQYHKQPRYRYYDYKKKALQRNLAFDITFEEFQDYWNKPCHYCNDLVDGIGIDRVDNEIGYVSGNTVSCCTTCNFMKRATPYAEFIDKCIKISNNLLSKHSV